MKLLTLLLSLASGETDRITMPAWECRAAQATMEQVWTQGARVERDDGALVFAVDCIIPTFLDLITLPSVGPCEWEA